MKVSKQELLKEIETLLSKYDGQMEISPYVLEYLDKEELEKLIKKLQKKQERVIEENHDWLEQFKKY